MEGQEMTEHQAGCRGASPTACILGSLLTILMRLTTPASKAAPRFSLSRCTSSMSSRATCISASVNYSYKKNLQGTIPKVWYTSQLNQASGTSPKKRAPP